MRHKSLIFPWLRADIQVSPISLFDQAVCWRRMCVCVYVKTWPCVTTANDHLSIICGGGGTWALRFPWAQAWHQLDLKKARRMKCRQFEQKKEKTQIQCKREESYLDLYSPPEWGLLKGFPWNRKKCCWENPAKKPPRTRPKQTKKKKPYTSFLNCKLERSLHYSLTHLSLCLVSFTLPVYQNVASVLWLILRKQLTATGRHMVVLSSCCGWAEKKKKTERKRASKKNRSNCKRLRVSHPAQPASRLASHAEAGGSHNKGLGEQTGLFGVVGPGVVYGVTIIHTHTPTKKKKITLAFNRG